MLTQYMVVYEVITTEPTSPLKHSRSTLMYDTLESAISWALDFEKNPNEFLEKNELYLEKTLTIYKGVWADREQLGINLMHSRTRPDKLSLIWSAAYSSFPIERLTEYVSGNE